MSLLAEGKSEACKCSKLFKRVIDNFYSFNRERPITRNKESKCIKYVLWIYYEKSRLILVSEVK